MRRDETTILVRAGQRGSGGLYFGPGTLRAH